LPDRIALSAGEQVISGVIPFLEKLECFFEPRWPFFTSPEAERCVGVILLLLGFIIALPIAFGNILPAIAIVLICLGLLVLENVQALSELPTSKQFNLRLVTVIPREKLRN